VLDVLAPAEARKDVVLLVLAVLGDQNPDVLPDYLV
jgi:hypothetical protein